MGENLGGGWAGLLARFTRLEVGESLRVARPFLPSCRVPLAGRAAFPPGPVRLSWVGLLGKVTRLFPNNRR